MEPSPPADAEPSTDDQYDTFQVPEPSTAPGDGSFHAGLSIDQAAIVLKVSSSTVRRWVKEGRLHSERVTTPQGHAFRVYFDKSAPGVEGSTAVAGEGRSATSYQEQVAPSVEATTPASMERADTLMKYNEGLIAPLVAELAETRTHLIAQADRIADLARENGTLAERLTHVERERDTLTSALAAEREARSTLEAQRAPQTIEPPTGEPPITLRWLVTRWWWAGAAAVVLLSLAIGWLLLR